MTGYRPMNMSQILSPHARSRFMRCGYCEYALCQLSPQQYRATVLSKLLYCNQAWSGFCSAAAKNRIDSFISHSKRSGYCADNVPPVAELFADSDNSLLKRVLSNENHTLHEMLPLINKHKYNLRKRPHNHQLPSKGNLFQQSNFIVRALYTRAY